MYKQIILYILISIAVTLMLDYFNKVKNGKPKINTDGNEVLKLPLLYCIIGFFSLFFGITVLVYGLVDYNSENIPSQIFIFLLLGGLGGLLILIQLKMKVILTEKELIEATLFGRKKTIRWERIESVRFNKYSLILSVQSKETTLKCHQHLIGFPILITRLEKELRISKEQMGITGF